MARKRSLKKVLDVLSAAKHIQIGTTKFVEIGNKNIKLHTDGSFKYNDEHRIKSLLEESREDTMKNLNQDDMSFLDDIKHIRRMDFIDGDLSLLWDHFIIRNTKAKKLLHHTKYDGMLKEGLSREDLIARLVTEFNLTESLRNINRDVEKLTIESEMRLFVSQDIQVQVQLWNSEGYDDNGKSHTSNAVGIGFISNSLETFERMEKICTEVVTVHKDTEGEIYVLKRSGGGLTLGTAGYAAEDLIPDNYSPEVMSKFNHMVEDLKSKNPCGRLNVLSGIPGVGKSFLLKAMLHHSKEMMFILVRPDLITQLGDPDFVTVLINEREENKPFVFIIEDADSILTERMADNMGAISAILNTSDGILGSTLDLRIVASTNAPKVEFDSAVMRPGRLCTHIEVGKLPIAQAHKIFLRETGKDIKDAEMEIMNDPHLAGKANKIGFGKNLDANSKGYTLAEIYKAVYLYKKTLEK